MGLIAGCTKLTKQESGNLAAFTRQTIDLIGMLECSLNDSQLRYLRSIDGYIDVEDPYTRYLALENRVGNILTALIT